MAKKTKKSIRLTDFTFMLSDDTGGMLLKDIAKYLNKPEKVVESYIASQINKNFYKNENGSYKLTFPAQHQIRVEVTGDSISRFMYWSQTKEEFTFKELKKNSVLRAHQLKSALSNTDNFVKNDMVKPYTYKLRENRLEDLVESIPLVPGVIKQRMQVIKLNKRMNFLTERLHKLEEQLNKIENT